MRHQLDFEKPIAELQSKLDELKKHPEAHSLHISVDEEIALIEVKIEEAKRQIYLNLSAWDRIKIARHPKRPFSLDYLGTSFTDFSELHGDRLYAEDRAVVGGFACLDTHKVMVIGTQKGRDTKENILRNFGSAHPEGYRKALRLMKLADKFRLPIITLIDTAGAYPGIGAEERHIAEAIAVNLREMTLFEVPIIAAVIGEGGSGGALGIGVADRVLILENAYYSVISPEGCAAILWKDRSAAAKAAEALKITARHLFELGLVDEIVPEPLGGAHTDPEKTCATLREALLRHLEGLLAISVEERLKGRYDKFRKFGHFSEKQAPPPEKVRPKTRARRVDKALGSKALVKLYPLTFQPLFKERVWGGRSLASLFQKQLPPNVPIGESWEISDRADDISVISNGPLAGRNLHQVLQEDRSRLLGSCRSSSDRFPLLIKLLDAREKLSLQVHPPAHKAAELGGEPKTEMWYIAHAEPGAELYVGLRKGVTRRDFESMLQDRTVAEAFHRIPVHSGDSMFLPSGRVHAIGAGLVIFEIQQNSDTTYRVFDWNRAGLDGKPRPLHISESLASIDFADFEPGLVKAPFSDSGPLKSKVLARCPFFETDLVSAGPSATANLAFASGVFRIIGVVNGAVTVLSDAEDVRLVPGGFCLVPACESVQLTSDPGSIFLVVKPGPVNGSD